MTTARMNGQFRSLVISSIAAIIAFVVLNQWWEKTTDNELPIAQSKSLPMDPRLDREIDAVDFDQANGKQVVSWFQTQAHLQIVENEDTHLSKLITLHLRHVKVRQILDIVVHKSWPIERSWWDITDYYSLGLDWEDINGVIVINSKDDFDRHHLVVRVYDVGPLLNELTAKNILERHIQQETWLENGGNFGEIHQCAGHLIITQTEEIQQQIALLLKLLRQPD